MDFTKALKTAAWTEAEVGTMVVGAIATVKFLDDTKLFKTAYATHPEWFNNNRPGAPFYIKWSGALKATASLVTIAMVPKLNPWVKLALMGVALQGSLQQLRILTYDTTKQSYRINTIGNKSTADIDSELRNLADKYRATHGPDYVEGQEYVGEYATRYNSSVAGKKDLGDRYKSAVAGVFDEDNDMGFGFEDSDSTAVGWAA